MLAPNEHKDAVKQIAWPTVLLVAGVSTYATILTTARLPEFVGNWAAGLGAVAHRCADPLLRRRRRLGVRLLDRAAAGDHPDRGPADRRRRHQRRRCSSPRSRCRSTIVDVSPFSTNGALMLANRPDTISEPVYYKQILTYSVIVVVVGPLLVWAALVLPGW